MVKGDVEEETKAAERAEETSESKGDAGEKRSHTPRSGLVLKSAEEVQMKDVEDPSKITDPQKAVKRRRKSRSKLAKKAARTRRRHQSPGPSVPPGPHPEDDEEDDADLDLNAFCVSNGVIDVADGPRAHEHRDICRGGKPLAWSGRAKSQIIRRQVGRLKGKLLAVEERTRKHAADQDQPRQGIETSIPERAKGRDRPMSKQQMMCCSG